MMYLVVYTALLVPSLEKNKKNVLTAPEVIIKTPIDKDHVTDVHLERTREKKDQKVLMIACQFAVTVHTLQPD
jgi:hypothetical protein